MGRSAAANDIERICIASEETLLSIVLTHPEAFGLVSKIVTRQDFFSIDAGKVYETAFLMWELDQAITGATLAIELLKIGIFDSLKIWLVKLLDFNEGPKAAEYHAKEIARLSAMRRIAQACDKALESRYDRNANPEKVLAEFDTATSKLLTVRNAEFVSIAEANEELVNSSEEQVKEGLKPLVGTGFRRLDAAIGGYERGSFNLIGGNTSNGKTAFAFQMAYKMAEQRQRVWFVSLEAKARELQKRLVSSITGIHVGKLVNNQMDDEDRRRIKNLTPGLKKIPLVISDDAYETLKSIKTKAKLLKGIEGLDVVFIDNLQLVVPPTNREERRLQVKSISRGLKKIAFDLDIVIIALSQLNTAAATREPQKDDWEDCKTINNDSSISLLLWRPGGTEDSRFVVKIAKDRNGGALGKIQYEFIAPVMRFQDPPDANGMFI